MDPDSIAPARLAFFFSARPPSEAAAFRLCLPPSTSLARPETPLRILQNSLGDRASERSGAKRSGIFVFVFRLPLQPRCIEDSLTVLLAHPLRQPKSTRHRQESSKDRTQRRSLRKLLLALIGVEREKPPKPIRDLGVWGGRSPAALTPRRRRPGLLQPGRIPPDGLPDGGRNRRKCWIGNGLGFAATSWRHWTQTPFDPPPRTAWAAVFGVDAHTSRGQGAMVVSTSFVGDGATVPGGRR